MLSSVLPTRLFDNVIQPMFFSVPPAESAVKIPRYFSFLVNLNLLIEWPAFAFSIVYHAEIVEVVFGGKFIDYSWLLPLVIGFSVDQTVASPRRWWRSTQKKPASS